MADQHGRERGGEESVNEGVLTRVGSDDDPVKEAYPQDVVERLLLGAVAQPEHHRGPLLGELVRDARSSWEKYGSPNKRCGSRWMTMPTTPERPVTNVRAAAFGR